MANGLMIQQGNGYPTLAVSEQGKTFLKNRDRLTLSRPRQESPAQQNEPGDRETAYDTKLFDELAALRLEIATEREVPAYVIFSNKALQQMAFHLPQNEFSFSKISGVGDSKLKGVQRAVLKGHHGVCWAAMGNRKRLVRLRLTNLKRKIPGGSALAFGKRLDWLNKGCH
ncbi:MAG: hypothetical protein CM1200mP27_06400 [Chloroflexota bacterium]|nr:MAG: hypothetical protein CM1200mP27_06400 [Chloroflexota bacterium]